MEKEFTSVLICKNPKTQILVDRRLSEKEKQIRIARYFDKRGNLKIDTVKDQNIYGTK